MKTTASVLDAILSGFGDDSGRVWALIVATLEGSWRGLLATCWLGWCPKGPRERFQPNLGAFEITIVTFWE